MVDILDNLISTKNSFITDFVTAEQQQRLVNWTLNTYQFPEIHSQESLKVTLYVPGHFHTLKTVGMFNFSISKLRFHINKRNNTKTTNKNKLL